MRTYRVIFALLLICPETFIRCSCSEPVALADSELNFAGVCINNISDPALFSPKTAKACRDALNYNSALYDRLTELAPEKASVIISYNNALIDLETVVHGQGAGLLLGLTRILETLPCPLCDLGLGPRPEQIFHWTQLNAPDRLAPLQEITKTWDTLGEQRHKIFTARGFSKATWNLQSIDQRYNTLESWALAETNRMLSAPKGTISREEVSIIFPLLSEDLPDGIIRIKLRLFAREVGVVVPVLGSNTGQASGDNLLTRTDMAVTEITSTGIEQKARTLNSVFDNSPGTRNALLKSLTDPDEAEVEAYYHFKGLTSSQARILADRLVQQMPDGKIAGPLGAELKGTLAGDEVLSFFQSSGAKLRLQIRKTPGASMGGWDPVSKKIAIDPELIRNWMRAQKPMVTPTQLLAGAPETNRHMLALAEYLSPSLIHEAVHQRQTFWAAENGVAISNINGNPALPIMMELETEAFSMDSIFISEKALTKDAGYLSRLNNLDLANYHAMMRGGVDEVRLANHRSPVYAQLPSLEGESAAQFQKAQRVALNLTSLRNSRMLGPLPAPQSKALEAAEAEMADKFHWYELSQQKAMRDELKINRWRKEILAKKLEQMRKRL